MLSSSTKSQGAYSAALSVVLFSVSPMVHADWLDVFSRDELPLRVVPHVASANFVCRAASSLRPTDFSPISLSAGLDTWLKDERIKDGDPKWAQIWAKALAPLGGFIRRVKDEGDGTYRFMPLSDGATAWLERSYESDSAAIELVYGLAAWTTRPSTLFENTPATESYLAPLQTAMRAVIGQAWQGAYVERSGRSWSRPSSIDATGYERFSVSYEAFHGYFFQQPVHLLPTPNPDQMRERLKRVHQQTVGSLQRHDEQRGEYRQWKLLEGAVDSLDLPDLKRELEEVKKAEQTRIVRRLAAALSDSLRGPRYVGSGARRPSVVGLGLSPVVLVSSNSQYCGVTELEAEAIQFLGDLAGAQARLYVAQELKNSGGLFGGNAGASDDEIKDLLRAFFGEASTALARRAAYEYFWVFQYRVVWDSSNKRQRVEPVLGGLESVETIRAASAAAALLDYVASSENWKIRGALERSP